MQRFLGTLVLFLAVCSLVQGHFVFLVPEDGDKQVMVVFSDQLKPDESVPISKVGKIELTMQDMDGKPTKLTTKQGKNELLAEVPGKGSRVIFGTSTFGVLQKGESKPFLLRYLVKAVVGGTDSKPLKNVNVEIVPLVKEGKVQFLVLHRGEPAAEAEVHVMHGDESTKLKTDKNGMTASVDAKGLMAARTLKSEMAQGEHDGKKYEEIREYATLVVRFPK